MSVDAVFDILKQRNIVCKLDSIDIVEATIDEVPDIIRFVSKESPLWMASTEEHKLRKAIEVCPGSVIIAKDEDNAICGLMSIFPTDDLLICSYALIGKNYRGQYLGTELGKVALDKAGGKNIVFSTVSCLVEKYVERGFKIDARQSVWHAKFYKKNCTLFCIHDDTDITKVNKQDVESVIQYDRGLHTYKREWYLETCIFGVPDRVAFLARQNTQCVGYGYLSLPPTSKTSYRIVLYANDEHIARQLLSSLVQEIPDGVVLMLTVPETKEATHRTCLVKELGLEEKSTITMMHFKEPVKYIWEKTFFSDAAILTLT